MTRSRISLASGAGSGNSPVGLIGAVLLHLAIIAVTLFTWEHRLDIVQESPPVVPVDLVTVAQKTNIAPTIRVEHKIEPMPIPQPAPPTNLNTQTPPLPQPQEKSELAPQPEVKPAPKPQPPKKTAEDPLAKIFNQWAAQTPHQQQQNAKPAQTTHKGIGQQNANTMDLVDALRNEIEQCWSPPTGAPHPEDLIVYIELTLTPDGRVSGAPHLTAQSQAAESGNPFMRAAADAAVRAIYVCSPFKLPPERYADWRDSTIKFDPRDLAGQ
jgi:outer membrane biosynthesis protein TonB